MTTCQKEIFGRPTCVNDAGCYTTCSAGQCVIPYDDPEPYLLDCFADNINTEVERYLRRSWGLTAQSTKDQFVTEFSSRMTDPGCVGPSSWQYNDRWESEQVDDCPEGTEGHECWCWQDPGQSTKFEAFVRTMAKRVYLGQPVLINAPALRDDSGSKMLIVHNSAPTRDSLARAYLEIMNKLPATMTTGAEGQQCWLNVFVPANQTACRAFSSVDSWGSTPVSLLSLSLSFTCAHRTG